MLTIPALKSGDGLYTCHRNMCGTLGDLLNRCSPTQFGQLPLPCANYELLACDLSCGSFQLGTSCLLTLLLACESALGQHACQTWCEQLLISRCNRCVKSSLFFTLSECFNDLHSQLVIKKPVFRALFLNTPTLSARTDKIPFDTWRIGGLFCHV